MQGELAKEIKEVKTLVSSYFLINSHNSNIEADGLCLLTYICTKLLFCCFTCYPKSSPKVFNSSFEKGCFHSFIIALSAFRF